jgi:hypothetical protein
MSYFGWLKKAFAKKPGLPKDARISPTNSYQTAYSFKDQKAFIEKVWRVKFPANIKTGKDWSEYERSGELKKILDKAETLTPEEISAHYVQDWDYLVKDFNFDEFLKWVSVFMEPSLKKHGDICMLPQHIFPGVLAGLRNEKGKIKTFIAASGDPAEGMELVRKEIAIKAMNNFDDTKRIVDKIGTTKWKSPKKKKK